MATQLVIRDGDPHWWNSPDIWVVPGSDPNGIPGQPVAGEPAFVWGRVRNAGEQPVSGAVVNFYWSNPATGVLRSNSTPIGTAFVDLVAGEAKEVLCVVPWLPVVVNDGHECLVAEVLHSADPLPVPLPDAFNPPAYRQVAQKNLTVLVMKKSARVLPVQVAAPPRMAAALTLTVEFGGELDQENLVQVGLKGFRPARSNPFKAGLGMDGGCDEGRIADMLKVELKPGSSRAVFLHLRPQDVLEPKTYQLVHVISRKGKEIEGGITYILVNAKEG
jgi:hypothetical protein